MPSKILVMKIGALGDILMSTPFLKELRRQNSKSKIDFLVGNNCKIILKGNESLDNVIGFDQTIFLKKKIPSFLSLISKIKKEKYDEIYVLDKHWIFDFFAYLCGIKIRNGFLRDKLSNSFLNGKKIKYKSVKHEVDYYLSLLEDVKSNVNKDFYFKTNREDKAFVERELKKMKIEKFVIFINLGGKNGVEDSDIRRLPKEVFKGLVSHISKKKKILFLGQDDSKDYYDQFLLNDNCINVAGKFSIGETIELMRLSENVYTTDCGPMHFAAVAKAKITVFFGPTNPKRKAPFVKGTKSIWKDEDIYEEEYELYGREYVVEKKFFSKIDVRDL